MCLKIVEIVVLFNFIVIILINRLLFLEWYFFFKVLDKWIFKLLDWKYNMFLKRKKYLGKLYMF